MSIQIDSPNNSQSILNSVDGLEGLQAALQLLVDGIEPSLGDPSVSPAVNTVQDRLKRLEDTLGLVGANPAANTIQDRLKQIQATLATLGGSATSAAVLTAPTVTTTAAVIMAADPATKAVRIQNDSAVTVYIGHVAGTTPTSYTFKLAPGDGASVEHSGDIYAVVAAGTAAILVTKYS